MSYPSAPSYVYFEDGWTYNGLTYSGLSVYGYSSSFTPSFPQATAAIEISFSSPFSVEMYVLTSYGTVNTFQENSGSLAFSTYLPEGGYFGNIYGEPNVPQFSINWYAENAVIPGSQSLSLVSTGTIYESGNWFNSTGGNSYQFQFSPASGALNGQTMDGIAWSTTLSYSVGHLLDYGYGAAVNLFSVNGKNITSPGLYNIFAGSLTDGNLATSVPIDISTANLVNYIPSLTSNSVSAQAAPITEGVNFTLNVSDTIQYEPYFISVDWGDGTYTVSGLSTNSSITLNHTFYSPGSYTPTVTITNTPNAPMGSLTSKIYNLQSVSISSIQVKAVTNTSEVNPFQAVGFRVTVPQETLPLSDGLVLSFGDGSMYSPPSFANFSVSHSYGRTGTFDAILEITARGNLVAENVGLKPISVVPISASAKSYESGMFEHLTLNYSSMSPLREVALYLNGTIAKVFTGPESSGNLYYNFTLDHDQKNFASWNLTTLYGYSMKVSQYYTQEFIPVITSLTSSSNPSASGSTVSFSYNINWGNDTGITEIEINGQIISGNAYIFTTPGTYNVTLVASNSQGSAEYSINEKIGSKPSINYLTSNSSSTFVRSSIEFKTNISWNGDDGNITWLVNGDPVMKNEVYLVYRFNYSGTFNVSVLVSNIFGSSTEYTYEFVHNGIPQMLRAYSSQNPLYAGNSGTFYADINWTGNTGIVTWAVNGHNISGDTYLFPSAGNYTVTATATNSYGANSTSFTEKVLSTVSKYAITFNETGLPLGTSWSVTFNGTTEISASDTITFTVPNGTYSYTVSPVSGYSVSPSSGSISVTGSNVSKAVTYTAMSIPPAKTHPSGLSNTDIYGIIGSVVALAAIGFAVVLMRKRK